MNSVYKGYSNNYRQLIGIKKLRYGWIAYNKTTGEAFCLPLKQKIHAQYVAARLMGKVDNAFVFGTL